MKLKGEAARPPRKAQIPVGTTSAILVRGIDAGTHDTGFAGKDGAPKFARRLHLAFETPKYRVEFTDKKTGQTKTGPCLLWLRVNATMGTRTKPSTLRDIWRALTGNDPEASDDVNLSDMIGRPCLVEVGHSKSEDGSVWERVENVMGFPDELPKPAPGTDFLWYDIQAQAPIPEWVGEKMADEIRKSPEWKGAEDDTPF